MASADLCLVSLSVATLVEEKLLSALNEGKPPLELLSLESRPVFLDVALKPHASALPALLQLPGFEDAPTCSEHSVARPCVLNFVVDWT